MGWAADQVEPGVSIANADPAANDALDVFACVGNRVSCARARRRAPPDGDRKARVVPRVQARLVHVGDDVLEQIAPGDELLVRACGRGMTVPDAPGVACHSLGPELWEAWGATPRAAAFRSPSRASCRPRSSGWGAAGSRPPRRSPSRRRTPPSCASTAWPTCASATSWPSATGTPPTTRATATAASRSASSRAATAPCPATAPRVTVLLSAGDGSLEPGIAPGREPGQMLGLGCARRGRAAPEPAPAPRDAKSR